MKTLKQLPALDELMDPLGDCLTPEAARRVLALKAPRRLQARMTELAERHSQGHLSPEELAEYDDYVSFSTFVAILKSKARQLLSSDNSK
jgi:hypothetical protein